MFNISIIDYTNRSAIDNIGDYLYLKESENGNFKVDAHQLDLRLHPLFTISFQCLKKKKKSKVGRSVIGWRSG